MQAFHNDTKVKDFYVSRMQAHHAADQIIQGTGWDGTNGCNVGCILHSYDHSRYPAELGLPEWYGHLCDKIFEGLPKDKAPAFALATLTAVKPGADIENVKWKLAIVRHSRDLERLQGNAEPYAEQCRAAIIQVIEYCQKQISGFGSESAESAARSAAESAAWSAARSARSARSAAGKNHYVWEAETLIALLCETV